MKKIILNSYFMISMIAFSCIMNLCCCSSLKQVGTSTAITVLITFLFGLYLLKKKSVELNLKKMSLIELLLSGYFSICYMIRFIKGIREMFKIGILGQVQIMNHKLLLILLVLLIFISMFFVFYGFYYLLCKIIPFAKREIKNATISEKKFFIVSFLIMFIINIIWYSVISNRAILKDDLLYSTDSNYVALKMFPNVIWHLDFRHIFFSILTFPFHSIFSTMRVFIPMHESIYLIFLAMFQVALLLCTAILLARILKNEKFMYFYALSFPTVFYAIIIEKFQLCVFLIVLFLYLRLQEKEEKELEEISLICATGAITTSAILGIWSNREKGFQKIKQWIAIGLLFIAVSVIFGKWNILITVFDYAKEFGDLSMKRRIYGITELFSSCLFAPLFKIWGNIFIWLNEARSLNILGAILFILCIYSFMKHHKNMYAQMCFSWICFALFLFLVMNWYCYEAPLFNLYFSWAILGLLFFVFVDILNKFKNNNWIWNTLFLVMATLNFNQMIHIFRFFLRF